MQVVCCWHDANLMFIKHKAQQTHLHLCAVPYPTPSWFTQGDNATKITSFRLFAKQIARKMFFAPIVNPLISVQLNIDRQTVTLQTVTF